MLYGFKANKSCDGTCPLIQYAQIYGEDDDAGELHSLFVLPAAKEMLRLYEASELPADAVAESLSTLSGAAGRLLQLLPLLQVRALVSLRLRLVPLHLR